MKLSLDEKKKELEKQHFEAAKAAFLGFLTLSCFDRSKKSQVNIRNKTRLSHFLKQMYI